MSFPEMFQSIGIYGVGLLGGSIGLAVKQMVPDRTVVGIGRSVERLEKAKQLGAIDTYTTDPSTLNQSLDLLIVCTPVSILPRHVEHAFPALKEGASITDVGSTKATVVKACEAIVGTRFAFIGSHPMAGSHKTGVEAAAAGLFQQKTCVLTPTKLSDEQAANRVADFWSALGMQVVRLTPDLHDRLVARSSHLPHLVAAALCHAVNKTGDEVLPLIGDGFKDTTRVAAGDPGMWTDICIENREEILAALEEMVAMINEFSSTIQQSDRNAVYEMLLRAREWKTSRFSR